MLRTRTRRLAVAVAAVAVLVGGAAFAQGATYQGLPVVSVYVNGRFVQSDVPAVKLGGRVMVPLRAVSEALGAQVSWDEASQSAGITDSEKCALAQVASQSVAWNLETIPALLQAIVALESHSPALTAEQQAQGQQVKQGLVSAIDAFKKAEPVLSDAVSRYCGSTTNQNSPTYSAPNYSPPGSSSPAPAAVNPQPQTGIESCPQREFDPGTGLPTAESSIRWALCVASQLSRIMPRNAPAPSLGGTLGSTYFGVGSGHWVSEKLDGGRYIRLEDGSLWEIAPLDRINTTLWLVADSITVTESKNALYPYLLINTSHGQTAEAKLINK